MSHSTSMRVAIVLPCYNEAENLPALLEKVKSLISNNPEMEYLVVIVDDGSTDETAQLLTSIGSQIAIKIIRHPRNLGLGAALRTGLRAALVEQAEAVVTLDADDTQDPALIPGMLARLQDYQLVVASRFCPGGRMIGVPLLRRAVSVCASSILSRIMPIDGVTDYSCGYRVYRSDLLREIEREFGPELFLEQGFACMFELLLRARKLHAKASEVPLVLRYDLKRSGSKMRIIRTALCYLRVLQRSL